VYAEEFVSKLTRLRYEALRRDIMSRRNGIMSEHLKEEIAKELGVYNIVKTDGWGAVSSRNCGNMVKKAIEMANRNSV
jgi:small acid-soluble spore protein F (minor alpha/beta-type SASP)